MSTPKEKFERADLNGAITDLTAEVKSNPTDATRRTFLFELLCFAGDYDRAERQLDPIGSQSASSELGVQVYRNNIKCERERRQLFSSGVAPHFLTEPPAYVDVQLEALNRFREGQFAEARKLMDQAEVERPALTGTLNGKEFGDF